MNILIAIALLAIVLLGGMFGYPWLLHKANQIFGPIFIGTALGASLGWGIVLLSNGLVYPLVPILAIIGGIVGLAAVLNCGLQDD